MANKGKQSGLQEVQRNAETLATSLDLELVDVYLQKESRGQCLLFFIDKEDGVSLSDCERFHKAVVPMVEMVDYDFLEVSSPGIDRPLKTQRDIEKNRGQKVEVKFFAKWQGNKQLTGILSDRTATEWVIEAPTGETLTFPLATVAVVRPVIDVDEADFSILQDISIDD